MMKATNLNMDPQTKKRTRDQLDADSETPQPTSTFPHFLLIESTVPDQPLSKLSPFVIEKVLVSIAGSPKSVKKLVSGALLVEVDKPRHAENLLKITRFFQIPAKCSPHVSLNTSRGIIRCPDLAGVTETEIVEELSKQNVTGARRITVFRDGVKRETNTIVLTFNTAILPKTLKVGYLNVGVELYIPNPLQCYTCFKYGHHERKCKKSASESLCKHCGELASTHDSSNCKEKVKCVNCDGEHNATSRACPVWKREKEIVSIKYKESLSFPEARKVVNSRQALTNSYSAVTKSNMSTLKQVKDATTQTSDVGVQTTHQKKPETAANTIEKSTTSTVNKTPSSASKRIKSPKKNQKDRLPKGSDDEIKKFNRFQCLDEDMEADDEVATSKQGGSRSRSIDEGSGSLEFHLDPNSKKLIPAPTKGSGKDRVPEFIVKPRRQYINEGETAMFKASFEGSPDTELTWSVNGKIVTSDERHKLYTENDCHMLEIHSTELADQGTYVCKIENTVGSTTATANLEVFVRPQQKKSKASKFVAPTVDTGLEDTEFVDREKDATLFCTFHNAVDAKASWFKDNKELGKWQTTATFDGKTAKLVLREASRRACGLYECVVRNSGGEAKTRCLVSLLDPSVKPIPPKFTQPLIDQTIETGEKLVLEVEVTGKPRPSLTWYQSKMELASNDDIRIDYKDDKGRLIMDNLSQSEALKFSCLAKNVAGEETSFAMVTVTASESREPPIFTKELHDMEVSDGDRVEMSVEVKGTPPIDIVWVHNNREIPTTDPVCRMVNDGNVRTLVIPEVFPEDSGEYVCEAYNAYGDTDTFCRLTVNEVSDKDCVPEITQRAPEFVTRPEKVQVKLGSSAILKCQVSGEPPPSVLWSKGSGTVKHGDHYKISSVGDEHFLEITNCVLEDSGVYTCNLSNIAGTASTSARVIVGESTHILTPTDFRTLLKKRSQKPEEKSTTTNNTAEGKSNTDSKTNKSDGFSHFNGNLKHRSSLPVPVERKKGVNQIDFRGVLKNKTSAAKNNDNSSGVNSSLSDSSGEIEKTCSERNKLVKEVPNSGFKSHHSRSYPSNLSNSPISKSDSRKHDTTHSESQIHGKKTSGLPTKLSGLSSKFDKPTDKSNSKGAFSHVDTSLYGQSKDKNFGQTNGSLGGLSRKRQFFEDCDSKVKDLPTKSVQSVQSRTNASGNKVNQVLQKFENSTKDTTSQPGDNNSRTSKRETGTRQTGFQPETKVSLKDRRESGANLSLTIADRAARFKSPENMDFDKSERKFTKAHSVENPKSDVRDSYIPRVKSVELPRSSNLTEYQTKQTEDQCSRTGSMFQSRNKTKCDSKPEFKTKLRDQSVNYGSGVILECGVIGAPVPEISWAVNDKTVKPSKFFKMSYLDEIAQLAISEAFSEDEGEYRCTAKNTAGTSSISCRVSVQKNIHQTPENSDSEILEEPFSPTATPPKVYNISPSDFCILKGGTIEFKASYTSVPPGKVTWCKGKTEITSGGRMFTETSEHFSTLTITNIQPEDSGRFDICVENALGCDKSKAWLTVEDVPEAPVGEPWVSEVTLTSAILTWSGPAYDGGCPVTNYRIEVCDAEEQEWTSISNSCVSTSFKIENLTPHTPYFFRIFAENKHGVSPPCQTSEVTVTKETRPSLTSRMNSVESDDVFTHETNDVCTPLSEYAIVSPLSPENSRAKDLRHDIDEIPFEHREVKVQSGRNFEQFYECKEEIGKGKFGYVYKCIEKSTGQLWAAKILKCRESEKKKIQMEVEIMNQLKHPKILMLWDVFEAPRKMILVMEFIGGGELFERVLDDDFELTERDCIQFMRQILDAVNYMHNRNILHLDLKPENILCIKNESNKVKIIDFGLARFYKPGENVRVLFGTPEFIAPEVVNYDEIGFTTDMWSIGVVCYVLLTGLSPFMGDTDAETLANVTQGDFDFEDESFDNVSDDGKHFIEKLLVKNKRKRMTSKEALDHRWLAEDAARLKTRKINTRNLKRFMARRKWQKTGNAIRALGRMTSLQRISRPISNINSSTNNSVADSPTSSSSSTLTLGSQGTVIEEKPLTTSFKVSDAEEIGEHKGLHETGGHSMDGSLRDNKLVNGGDNTMPGKDINSNIDSVNLASLNAAFSGLKISSNEESKVLANQQSGQGHVTSANSHSKSEANNLKSHKHDDFQNRNYKCPEFTKEMVESKAFPGDNVRFDIEYLGKNNNTTVTWYFEDEVIQEDPRHYIQETVEGSCSLIIKDICEDDDGEYSCKIQNEYGEDTCAAELIVYGAI